MGLARRRSMKTLAAALVIAATLLGVESAMAQQKP
jgi:hypothetical protein